MPNSHTPNREKRQVTYTVSKFDSLFYRLFHRQIEAIKATDFYQNLAEKLDDLTEKWHNRPSQDPIIVDSYTPKRSVLPYVAAATLLTAIAVDFVSHNDIPNNPSNTNTSLSQLLSDIYTSTSKPTEVVESGTKQPEKPIETKNNLFPSIVYPQSLHVAKQANQKSTDLESSFDFPDITNTEFLILPTGLQDLVLAYDRASIDKALTDFRQQQGLVGELVEGLLLYTQDAAHSELRTAGINGRDAYTYKQMKPNIVAIVHSIPGLKKYIKDDFPAIIGIESDFKAELGPNFAGACGLSQVTNNGGYYEFFHPLISHSKEARQFRAENPRLVAGMDYMFEGMLHHEETRNLLAFYSETFDVLNKEVIDLVDQASKLRDERKYAEADQIDAEVKERRALMRKPLALRNFVNMQFNFVHSNFSNSNYKKRKTKLSSEKFDIDATMKELIDAFPEIAESTGVEYKQGEDWLAHLDILTQLKDTWQQARFHPVFNTYMGAFVYALDDFRVNNHPYVQKKINDPELRSDIVQQAYNAGWYRIKQSLDKGKLPTVADKYVKKHEERDRIFQQGHRTLYDDNSGIYAAKTRVFEGQLPRILSQEQGKKFHSTQLTRVVRDHNVAQRNYK